jgi:hypothetical protein
MTIEPLMVSRLIAQIRDADRRQLRERAAVLLARLSGGGKAALLLIRTTGFPAR